MVSETSDRNAERRRNDPARVVAFSDGVFAIIITILVLEIGVPSNLSEQSLRQALNEVGPTLIAWVISFLLVGMYWVWHRGVFDLVREVNRDLIWLNLLFLLPVSLVPFAASVLGEYHDDAIALRLYGVVLVVVSLTRIVFFAYLTRRTGLLWEPVPARTKRLALLLSLCTIVAYLLAMGLAAISHIASLAIYCAVPGMYFVTITLLRQRPSTADDAADLS